MFKKYPNGTSETIQGYVCQIPEIGYGRNIATGEIEYIGVMKSSNKAEEQMWQAIKIPDDYNKRRRKELDKQSSDPEFFDDELEAIRQTHWRHRLCGIWVMINGKATYIPPSYFFYLNYCYMDIGLPQYRDSDRKFFYVWEYCVEDPKCAGLVNIQRRRTGKSYIAGSILLDRTSRLKNHHAGIQSKTAPDAKQLFQKTVVSFFKKMPEFFRPIYDQSKGVTPTTELRFFKTTVKGKKAESVLEGKELESWIDFGSAEMFHYDGSKLNTYVMDEFGKVISDSVWDRWNVVRFCLDQDGHWIGKALLTSTIEEMESGGEAAKKIWDSSNPNDKDANGRTKSGLYRFFLPAFETTMFDKYGMPKIEEARTFYLNQREGLKDDPAALSSIIRKNPFTVEEAFRIDGEKCLFDAMKLNDRLEYLSWNEELVERGNFEWKDGVRDGKVVWAKSKNGRWYMPKGFFFEREEDMNKVVKVGNQVRPNNKLSFVSGIDPYDHDVTEDSRRSMAASFVLKKNNPSEDPAFNRAFVCMYFARPDFAAIVYEDMIKQCHYFGCQILYENQKPGIKRYFQDRGYGDFLIHLPGYNDTGIPSTPENKRTLAELTEEYITNNIDKVFFSKLLQQWLEFDLKETQKFDLAMAAGWTLVADMYKLARRELTELRDITEYFSTFKN